MALILNIDTSNQAASVSLADAGIILSFSENKFQKDHAGFLHPALQQIMTETGKAFSDIDAIAVTAGPGSYTGIRVGMATAKGLCFALNKPLIAINTLELLAREATDSFPGNDSYMYCPMIDARRMEIYMAMYDNEGTEIVSPNALIIDEDFFRKFSTNYQLILFGSGAAKCKELKCFNNAIFIENVNVPQALASLGHDFYLQKRFTDLVFSEPFYLKEFFNKQ